MFETSLPSDIQGFVAATAGAVVLVAPPLAGKTTALGKRAQRVGAPAVWASRSQPPDILPDGSSVTGLLAWGVTQYERATPDPCRVVDHAELRRFFYEVNDALRDRKEPWFEAYCAAKRTQSRSGTPVTGLVARYGLQSAGRSAADSLQTVIAKTDAGLMGQGMIGPWDAVSAWRDWLSTRNAEEGLGHWHICVDDLQLLSSAELGLLVALRRVGCMVSVTVGRNQCFNLRDGSVGIAAVSSLHKAGFHVVHGRSAIGMSPSHLQAMAAAARAYREPLAEALGQGQLVIEYCQHQAEDEALSAISELLGSDADAVSEGESAVLVPLPEMAHHVAEALVEIGVPAVVAGRHAGSGAAGFLVCSSLARAIRDPADVVALRQLATLWLDDQSSFDLAAQRSHDEGCQLAHAAIGLPDEEQFAELDAWLTAAAGARPADIVGLLQATPHWVELPVQTEAVQSWLEIVHAAGCSDDWGAAGWHQVLAKSADFLEGQIRSHRGAVVVAALQDCGGARWDVVDLYGFCNGLIPAHTVPSERDYEAHALIQVISRTTRTLRLHYVKKLRLSQDGPAVMLRKSPLAVQLGVVRGRLRPRPSPRHGLTETFKP